MSNHHYEDFLDKHIHRLVNKAKYEEAIEYIDSILPEISKIKNKKKELDLLIKKGAILFMLGEFLDAQEINKKASHLAMQLQCISSEIKILNNSAIISIHYGDTNTAIFQYQNALELAVKLGLSKKIGEIKYNLGLVHYRIGNFKLASEYLHTSKGIASDLEDLEGVLLCENVIGEILRKTGKPNKALETHKSLMKIVKENALTHRIFDVRRNILLDDFAFLKDKGIINSLEKLLHDVEEIDARSLYPQIAYDLAEIYFSLEDYDNALKYLLIAEEHVKMRIRTFLLPPVFTMIAHVNLLNGKRYYKRAEKYCLQSLDWAEANSNFKEVVRANMLLGQLKLKSNQIEEALNYYQIALDKLILIDDEKIKKSVLDEYSVFLNIYNQCDPSLKLHFREEEKTGRFASSH